MPFILSIIRILSRPVMAIAAGLIGLVLGANFWVIHRSSGQIVAKSEELPSGNIGIVLGTAPRRGRFSNPFFEGRMNTAAILYRAGKVRHLLLTGDNGTKEYDEPTAMKMALLARGVPASAITLDYAGFRTLDSIVRARKVFGVQHATIITDDFHEPRALFLADSFGLDAVGYASQRVPFRWSKKTRLREVGSRVKACLDVYVLRVHPKYGGRSEPIALL